MSRTYVHKPLNVAFTPTAIWTGPRQNATLDEFFLALDTVPWQTARKHYARPGVVRVVAKRHNRKARQNAKAALKRGDYDALSTRYSARHNAAWECM